MKVVEGSVWIPWICIVVIGILTIAFQYMEWGIVQGEMLTTSVESICYVEKEGEEKEVSNERVMQKIHFLKNGNLKIIHGKKEVQSDFSAGIGSFKNVKIREKTMKIKTQNPIEKLRRRKRFGEAIQQSGLS